MNYNYSISVLNDKSVRIGLYRTDLNQSGALSDMDLNYITETITELNQVIAGQLSDLSWGTVFFCVISEGNISWYGDYEKVERYQTSTISFRDYLIELKNFKEQCLSGDYYKTIVGQAFTQIKNNPSGTKKWVHGTHYGIVINGKIVSLNLSEDDFNLTESQYIAQLKRDF
jgi:hypothetical protein